MELKRKLKVAVLGATGMVGQRFLTILENHPWFDVAVLAASPRSAGKTYEQSARARWAIETPFPEKYKDVVYLHYYEGWKTEDIARHVGAPPSTVRNRLLDARGLLRKALGGERA